MDLHEREKGEVLIDLVGWDVKITVCSKDDRFNLLARHAAYYEGTLQRTAAILLVLVLQLVLALGYLLLDVEIGLVLLGVLLVPVGSLTIHHWRGVQARESFKAFEKARNRERKDQS